MAYFKIDDKVYCAFNPLAIVDYDEEGNIVEGTISEIETKTTVDYRDTKTETMYRIYVGLDSTSAKESEVFATYKEAKQNALLLVEKEIGYVEKRLAKLKQCKSIVKSK